MKTKLLTLCSLLAVLLCSGLQGAAYIKFDGVDGEAKDGKHDKWIEVLSIDWGTTDGRPAKRGAGKLTVSKKIEKSSPKLQKVCAKGTYFKRVHLKVIERGKPTMLYVLTGAKVTSYKRSSADDRPTEEVAFYYNKIKFTPARPKPAKSGASKANVEKARKVEKGK